MAINPKKIITANFEKISQAREQAEKKRAFFDLKLGEERAANFQKNLKLAAKIVAVILLLVLIAKIPSLFSKKGRSPVPTQTEPVSRPQTASPSAYATDSAVLKIEKDLQNLDQELQNTQLDGSTLLSPEIDLQVKFDL